jgi:hypothetical protein
MKRLIARALLAFALIAGTAALTLHPQARAEEPGRNPNGLVGIWRCSGAVPGLRPEILSIQPDGYVVIDAAGHILVGTARVEFPQPWQGAVVLAVKDSDLRDSIGTTVRLSLKVNSGYSMMGIGFEIDRPFELNRLCHRMEAEH